MPMWDTRGMTLTLPMLRLLSSKAHWCKDFCKPYKPCHVGIQWEALIEYSQMSTHLPGFWSFSAFLHHFVLAKVATTSIRVKSPLLIRPSVANHLSINSRSWVVWSWKSFLRSWASEFYNSGHHQDSIQKQHHLTLTYISVPLSLKGHFCLLLRWYPWRPTKGKLYDPLRFQTPPHHRRTVPLNSRQWPLILTLTSDLDLELWSWPWPLILTLNSDLELWSWPC